MFPQFIKILCNVSGIVLLLSLSYKVYKEKFLIVTSLVFWTTFFYFSYITFPSMFIEGINKNWSFSLATLSYTRFIVLISNICFTVYNCLFSHGDDTFIKELEIKERYRIVYQISYFIIIIGFFIISISILQLLNVRRNINGYKAYFEIRHSAEVLESKYHIRMILYMLLSASFYLFWKKRKVLFFFPLLGIVLFETLAGKRTTAFIVLLYLYVIYVLTKKKLALKIILPIVFMLLVGILFARSKAVASEMDIYLIFGEFFETFTTLPFIIDNNLIGKGFLLERILSDYTFASFIPGSLKQYIVTYLSSGSEIARLVGRGYGLGSNFITEQLYEFGFIGFLTTFFIPLIIINFDKKFKGADNLIIKIIFIFQLRLYIREGITQFMITLYIIIIYVSLFYFLSKRHIYFVSKKKCKKRMTTFKYLKINIL